MVSLIPFGSVIQKGVIVLNWTFNTDQPIYTQLVYQITRAILSGELPAGSRMPAVRELAAEAGVNPNTVQRAMTELEQRGLIYSQRTAGRFVTEDGAVIGESRRKLARQEAKTFLSAMAALGYERKQILQILQEDEEVSDGTSGV